MWSDPARLEAELVRDGVDARRFLFGLVLRPCHNTQPKVPKELAEMGRTIVGGETSLED